MRRTNPDPMPMLRMAAVARVNEHFNRRAGELMHIDHAHMRKRHIAAAVMSGEAIGADHPFAQEAVMRGINVSDFAQMIANKQDAVLHRELHRQRVIASIEQATTPAELDAITSKIG